MSLAVSVRKRLGAFQLDAAFVTGGRLTALFGRSGAGKTTLVNIIAGLVRPDDGTVAIDGTVMVDTAARRFLPIHRRRVGYVFQESRLFPHLSVRSNLLYGRWLTPKRERWGSFERTVELLGIAPLLARRPVDLSGGEKQRVAIGRALLAGPRLLLLDEPLAALDQARRAEILPYVERLRDEMGLPIVYVSHAIEEVARLADTVVLMSDGKVAATGSVNDVFSRLDLRPLTGRFEAGTVLTATVREHDAANGVSRLDHGSGLLTVPLIDAAPGTRVRVRIRARDVALAVGEPGVLSIRNRLAARIAEIAEGPPPVVEVRLDLGGEMLLARITRDAAAELELAVGMPVTALIKTTAVERPHSAVTGPAGPPV